MKNKNGNSYRMRCVGTRYCTYRGYEIHNNYHATETQVLISKYSGNPHILPLFIGCTITSNGFSQVVNCSSKNWKAVCKSHIDSLL